MSNKSERKRLRKGISLVDLDPTSTVGIARANLESAIEQARSLSVNLARTRPGECAWVYRFSVPGTQVCWVGVRFSERPESGDILDDERFIRLQAIIGYRNGERISPLECTTVHGLRPYQVAAIQSVLDAYDDKSEGGGKVVMSFPSNDLVGKYRNYFQKKFGRD